MMQTAFKILTMTPEKKTPTMLLMGEDETQAKESGHRTMAAMCAGLECGSGLKNFRILFPFDAA
jgi:hypothetical protein